MMFGGGVTSASAQNEAVASFKSSVDVVRVSAIVRDQRGRFVRDLSAKDFEVIDGGRPQRISDFRHDLAGVSLAMLFDVSGSMEGQMENAHEAATHVLSWLDAERDEVAIFAFDSRLDEILDFTTGLRRLPEAMTSMMPFGATSLHDAIAETARLVAKREGRRHAVVVFTDGTDTSSRLSPSEVSGIASSIDVPVYIFGIVSAIDNPAEEIAAPAAQALLTGALANLAAWTGGHMLVASTIGQRSVAARQIVDELRHQYLIAFESSGKPGWHPLVVRARSKDLVVRARSGYYAGQYRPNSH
jgi:Ca-activated chloride channel family protein